MYIRNLNQVNKDKNKIFVFAKVCKPVSCNWWDPRILTFASLQDSFILGMLVGFLHELWLLQQLTAQSID